MIPPFFSMRFRHRSHKPYVIVFKTVNRVSSRSHIFTQLPPKLQVVFVDCRDLREPQDWRYARIQAEQKRSLSDVPKELVQDAQISTAATYSGIGSEVLEGVNVDLMRHFNIVATLVVWQNCFCRLPLPLGLYVQQSCSTKISQV